MDISKLTKKFEVRKLKESDIEAVYKVMQGNPLYFQHCPPMATHQSILECFKSLKAEGYHYIRLGFAKENPQSEAFWLKNGFERTGVEDVQERFHTL